MNLKELSILILLFASIQNTNGQSSKSFNFTINKKIKEKIDTENYIRNVAGYVEFKNYENGNLVNNTFGEYQKLAFYQEPLVHNNMLVFILGGPNVFETIVGISSDSCLLDIIALDGLVDNYEPDSIIGVRCLQKKITLVSKPIIKEGEIVEGILELSSDNYIDFRDVEPIKRRFDRRAYFRIIVPKTEEN